MLVKELVVDHVSVWGVILQGGVTIKTASVPIQTVPGLNGKIVDSDVKPRTNLQIVCMGTFS